MTTADEINYVVQHLHYFYYTQKMKKYSGIISFKGMKTDTFFGSMVRSTYKTCKEDINPLSNFKSLIQYANW